MTKETHIEFGSVQYAKEIEPTPASQTVKGNVTTNYAATPGSPQYFRVHFFVGLHDNYDGVEISNYIGWDVAVVGMPASTPYDEIETAAARSLVQSMRRAADELDRLVNESESQND